MNNLSISEIIKKRQQRNLQEHLNRIEQVEKLNPEFKEIERKRNFYFGEAAKHMVLNEFEEAEKFKIKASLLDKHEEELLRSLNLPEDYLDDIVECSKCNDQGFLNNGELCDCIKRILRKEKYSNYDLTIDFKNNTFENFDLNLFSTKLNKEFQSSPREIMEFYLNFALDYCQNFTPESKSLFITGDPGRGKTYYVSCIVNELIKKDIDIIYISAPNLINHLYADLSNKSRSSESFLDEFKNIELLVIDDLGTENSNNFNVNLLSELIDYRILKQKTTIITSNLKPTILLKSTNYPERMTSRILGYYEVLNFIGSDLRIKLVNN